MQRCSRLACRLFTAPYPISESHLPRANRWIQSNVCTLQRHGFTSSSACSNTFSWKVDRFNPKCSSLIEIPSRARYGQPLTIRLAHTSSNSKWLNRQSSDRFSREAKVANLKSRAAFKLLQINEKHKIFRPGMTVVDLGYAPGSWSQVAIDLVRPGVGRVVGVDVIPVQPPKGVNGMQGNFLSPEVQARVREFLRDESRGKVRRTNIGEEGDAAIVGDDTGYLEREIALTESEMRLEEASTMAVDSEPQDGSEHEGKCVDVVLSDMSEPWEITSGLYKNSISNPYRRMMNTTGNKFKDHAGSMDLCRSALYFSYETLKIGGSFVCKFYQGAEDKQLEKQLKALFAKVHREKPESSRSESRESFFVCTRRIARADPEKVFDEG